MSETGSAGAPDPPAWGRIMLQIVVAAGGAAAVFFVGRKAFKHLKPSDAKGGGGSSSPMEIVATGVSCLQSNVGPIELQDLALGLAAMAKVTEKDLPGPVGEPADKEAADPLFLMEAQHWRGHVEAVYSGDSATWSLLTHLPENAIVAAQWAPNPDNLRPAYVVSVDPSFGAVVVGIRGTSDVSDMLLSASTHPEEFEGGTVHAGFKHAALSLIEEIEPHLGPAMETLEGTKPRLVLAGHSLGYAVAVLSGLLLRPKFPTLMVWGVGPPACTDLNLARKCSEYATAFVAGHDLVPRFSLATVEKLRKRVLSFDWERADELAKDDPDWENIKKASAALRNIGGTTDGVLGKVMQAGNACQDLGNNVKGAAVQVGRASPFGGNGEEGDGEEEEAKEQGQQESQNGRKEENGGGEKEDSEPQPTMLYPPGRLFLLHSDPPGAGKMPYQRNSVPQQRQYGSFPSFEEAKQATWHLRKVDPEMLDNIIISPWCISDHMPGMLNVGLDALQKKAKPCIPT